MGWGQIELASLLYRYKNEETTKLFLRRRTREPPSDRRGTSLICARYNRVDFYLLQSCIQHLIAHRYEFVNFQRTLLYQYQKIYDISYL